MCGSWIMAGQNALVIRTIVTVQHSQTTCDAEVVWSWKGIPKVVEKLI